MAPTTAKRQAEAINTVVTQGGGSEMISVSPTKNHVKINVMMDTAKQAYSIRVNIVRTKKVPYSSIRYKKPEVRKNNAFPKTAGEAMKPSSNSFTDATLKVRPAFSTVVLPCLL